MGDASRYAGWGPREADLLLLSLPRRCRTALLLHSKGGHSCAAIARHFGTTPEHVERLIARALVGMLRAARVIERHRSSETGALPLVVRLRLRLGLIF